MEIEFSWTGILARSWFLRNLKIALVTSSGDLQECCIGCCGVNTLLENHFLSSFFSDRVNFLINCWNQNHFVLNKKNSILFSWLSGWPRGQYQHISEDKKIILISVWNGKDQTVKNYMAWQYFANIYGY